MTDEQLTRWRSIADLDERPGQPVGEALREAAGEVERLRGELRHAQLGHIGSLPGRIDTTQSDPATMRQLYNAWWSARIGRAKARERLRWARANLMIRGDEVKALRARNQRLADERNELTTLLRDLIDCDDCWCDITAEA